MKDRVRKIISKLLITCIVALLVPVNILTSFAADARIAFSDPQTTVGEEVSVTMKFTITSGEVLGNTDVMLSYDPTLLEYINETETASGGNGAIRVWSEVQTDSEAETLLRFKAIKPGTAVINITTWEGYDNEGNMVNVEREGTSTVTIDALETSSTDATLQSLQISPGTLVPSFSPTVYEYTTTVSDTDERLTISAETNNDQANIAVAGNENLQLGENKSTVTVTAEDGTTTNVYNITITKEAVVTESESVQEESFDVLAELKCAESTIRILEVPAGVAILEGYKESKIAIGDVQVTGWIRDVEGNPEYCVLYGVNNDNKEGYYRYDLTEKTIQRYFESVKEDNSDAIAVTEQYNALAETYNLVRIALFGAIAVAIVLLFALISVMLRAKRSEREFEEQLQEQTNNEMKEPPVVAVSQKIDRENVTDGELYDVEEELVSTLAQEATKVSERLEEEDDDDFIIVDLDDELED